MCPESQNLQAVLEMAGVRGALYVLKVQVHIPNQSSSYSSDKHRDRQ
jgi:hypothetical protein